jgi:hypothetical protein
MGALRPRARSTRAAQRLSRPRALRRRQRFEARARSPAHRIECACKASRGGIRWADAEWWLNECRIRPPTAHQSSSRVRIKPQSSFHRLSPGDPAPRKHQPYSFRPGRGPRRPMRRRASQDRPATRRSDEHVSDRLERDDGRGSGCRCWRESGRGPSLTKVVARSSTACFRPRSEAGSALATFKMALTFVAASAIDSIKASAPAGSFAASFAAVDSWMSR